MLFTSMLLSLYLLLVVEKIYELALAGISKMSVLLPLLFLDSRRDDEMPNSAFHNCRSLVFLLRF